MSTSRQTLLVLLLTLAIAPLGVAACAPNPSPRVSCTPPQREYQGSCLDGVVVNFAGCTASRGNDLSTEERQKFEAAVDLGLKGASGVVELSKKIVATENSEVAIEIVKNCLEVSKLGASSADQARIQQEVDQLQGMLDAISTGTISLDPTRGPYRQPIDVSGTNWPANIEVEVSAGPSRVRATTTADGSFQATITLDPRLEGVSPGTVEIRVSPVKASTQLGTSALYTIEK